jgi:DNA polymerase I-like protein with 3'-5' exonuclease and polymerase domains
VENRRQHKWVNEPKTQKGKNNRLQKVTAHKHESVRAKDNKNKYDVHVRFNVGSNKQLEMLFCGELGMVAQFKTEKDSPSFKSCFLHQWGDGGTILAKRRKRLLVLKQAQALYELSAYDGRWHMDLKACGTATGRFAGGSRV